MTSGRQSLPEPGKRVVLVLPGPDPAKYGGGDDRRLTGALKQVAALGWHLAAVVDPSRHLQGLQMVLDGLADLVVVTRPEDFPIVVLAADLGGGRASDPSHQRAQRVLRPEMQETDRPRAEGSGRAGPRPRLVALTTEAPSPAERRTEMVDRSGASGESAPVRAGRMRRPA